MMIEATHTHATASHRPPHPLSYSSSRMWTSVTGARIAVALESENDYAVALSRVAHVLDGALPQDFAVTEMESDGFTFRSLDRQTFLALYALRQQIEKGRTSLAGRPLVWASNDAKMLWMAWRKLDNLSAQEAACEFVVLVRASAESNNVEPTWFEWLFGDHATTAADEWGFSCTAVRCHTSRTDDGSTITPTPMPADSRPSKPADSLTSETVTFSRKPEPSFSDLFPSVRQLERRLPEPTRSVPSVHELEQPLPSVHELEQPLPVANASAQLSDLAGTWV